jgi:deoxycytidylate deaminase
MKRWIQNREIFVGLIAPIGVDLNAVQDALRRALQSVDYQTSAIRLTDALKPNHTELEAEGKGLFERYEALIAAGNKLRSENSPDIFSHITIQEVIRQRKESDSKTSDRRATLIRQFKRTEEVELLKQVYGSNIIFVSCYAPRPVRIKYFVDRFMSESRAQSRTHYEAQALELIAKDEHEAGDPNGQRLLDTYAMADFVIDGSTPQSLTVAAERFVEAFFGYPFISPTREEYGAFVAHSASLRSADLSRQVGAAIFGPSGEIVALGCNEVPKAGGGTYWTGDPADSRDFRVGHDSNAKIRNDMINDALVHLEAAGWRPPVVTKTDALDSAMIQDLLEYGRVIHAEMNAICDASRFGRSTSESTLYCTTLPCHICSRHIVAAGVRRVVYFQPYHKSLAKEMYPDSIAFDDSDGRVQGRVVFSSFSGVTPNAFQKVFAKGRRKEVDGAASEWVKTKALPIALGSTEYLQMEKVALDQFGATREPNASVEGAHAASGLSTTPVSVVEECPTLQKDPQGSDKR